MSLVQVGVQNVKQLCILFHFESNLYCVQDSRPNKTNHPFIHSTEVYLYTLTMSSMSFSAGKQFVKPPQRGIFPLDHDAECKTAMQVSVMIKYCIVWFVPDRAFTLINILLNSIVP